MLIVSICYFISYIVLLIVREFTSYSLTNNTLGSILLIGFFLTPFIPFFWFIYIKRLKLKNGLIIGYSLLLSPILLLSMMGFFLSSLNLIFTPDNGFRPVFEKRIDSKNWLVIYRTPDQGALGGDHIQPAIVNKICSGIEHRKWLKETDIISNNSSDSNYVMIGNVQYMIPKEDVLRQRGNLK